MKSIEERFSENSIPEPNSGCIIWIGYSTNGYGRLKIDGKFRMAHIVAYEITKGQIPDGLNLDHLCRVPCCVNPDHLEPVTQSVNVRRGLLPSLVAARNRTRKATHCKRGHERTPENVYQSTRQCRLCLLERGRRLRYSARA